MTTENKAIDDLLKPRYKVIADYPYSKFNIGDIISMTHKEDVGMGQFEWATDFIGDEEDGMERYGEREFSYYPHLFKKLEWWEERDKYNMPKYVSFPHGHHKFKEGEVVEVFNWYKYPDACIFHNHYHAGWLLPATEAEYFNQKQQGHEK